MTDLIPLLTQLADKLRQKGQIVATAESCTGGLISSYLTHLPGSSAWFDRGFVTYSNQAKEELLGVDKQLIETHGAVSEEVAKAMVAGALKHSHATLAVAVTGIAGPDGGSIEKPVGTVWLAFATAQLIQTKCCQFGLIGREEIRQLTCKEALLGLLEHV